VGVFDAVISGRNRCMIALLSTRFRRLLIFMLAVPIGGRLLEAAGRRLERAAGPTRVSRTLRSGGRAAGRFSRGPLRPRHAPDAPQPDHPTTAPGSGLNGHSRKTSSRRSRR
jgi:hypothetical protein